MSNPLVSIIIPVRNGARYISDTLDCCLNQSYRPIEIIVVDNDSDDQTAEVVKSWLSSGLITYIHQKDRGPAGARNTGIRLAKGKYLQFLDADDLLAPEKIERQVSMLERARDAMIAGCDFRLFKHSDFSATYGGDTFKGQFPINSPQDLFQFYTVIHRWLFPSELARSIDSFEEDAPVTEDWLFLWKLVAEGAKTTYIDEPLVFYRQHDSNITIDFEKIAVSHLRTIDYIEEYQSSRGRSLYSKRELNQLRESYRYELGLYKLRKNRVLAASHDMVRAILLSSNRLQVKLLAAAMMPFLRTSTPKWAISANNHLWRWRARVSQGIDWLMTQSRIQSSRNAFYAWRQRRPVKRFLSAIGFIAVWPVSWIVRRVQPSVSQTRKTRRILVIHFGGLGDTLMLTPALRALKDHYPQARLDLLTLHEPVKEAFHNHSRIDSITTLPPYSGQWIVSRFTNLSGAKAIQRAIRYYPDLLLKLLFRRYDLAVNFGMSDFDRRLGNALVCCVDIPTRAAAATADDRLLTNRVDVSSAQRHRVDSYLDVLKSLGVNKPSTSYEYPVTSANVQDVKAFLRDHGVDESNRLAVIHPGGKLHVNSRRWPADYFARVCDFLVAEGFQVLLAGDRGDVEVCDDVARFAKHQTISIAGLLTFSETAALLSFADLAVTNDTATLHLADAVQVPRVVSIFGPTDPSVLAPQNERHIVFRSSLPCAPCMGGLIDAKTERCWRDVKEECLWQTSPDQVIAVLSEAYRTRVARAANA